MQFILQVRGKTSGAREDEVESRRASSRGLIPKAKVKTVKMTFVIIFVFILCWSPYIFFDLLQVKSLTFQSKIKITQKVLSLFIHKSRFRCSGSSLTTPPIARWPPSSRVWPR